MIARHWLERARPRIEKRFLEPVGALVETARALRTRAQIVVVRQRTRVHRRFPAPIAVPPGPRVLAVVTHVADASRDPGESAKRLGATLDGLLESLAHTRLEIVLNTVPGGHATSSLPEHQRRRITVREHGDVEPLFAGFEAQRELAERVDDAEWFLYLEDDLVLRDGLLLEKLAYFNESAPRNALLIPHRYELQQGRKVYIDLMTRKAPHPDYAWNRLTLLEIAGWKFAEFENPHSGCYFLSQAQLRTWMETGRHWYGLASFVGPRESAATGSLEECFRLYKPHPENMNFLEIRHLGTKYADLYSTVHDLEDPHHASRGRVTRTQATEG
jgi:hypothetical protein